MAKKAGTVEFPRDEMIEMLDDGAFISDELTNHSRWSVTHEIIFEKDGKFYRSYYSVGATEQQDEGPWDYEEMVECTEVVPQEKTVMVYVPKEDDE